MPTFSAVKSASTPRTPSPDRAPRRPERHDRAPAPAVYAVSDLHVRYPANRAFVARLRPRTDHDWLIVAGDVGEFAADVEWALRTLADRFHTVVWAPGNHELWTPPTDPVQLRGEQRYLHLVALCRRLGVVTPEDPWPVWRGEGGPVAIVPLHLLYDHTLLPAGTATTEEALARARAADIVSTDEVHLHTDPYPGVADWCRARVELTERRLAALDPELPTVLVNHFPLTAHPTRTLHHPEFALWCGARRTAHWHRRYHALAVVYGHLHIPRTHFVDGVRCEEVSVGYPREWRARGEQPPAPRRILPFAPADDEPAPAAYEPATAAAEPATVTDEPTPVPLTPAPGADEPATAPPGAAA
ncbi:metallophosphoesterase family protein [Streptomyces sp. NPDC059534]|uniref:metallophosphoesterase family protein n=1 Tax=Streptomyces sp. NPDC059534 TaxID=3346859 RepID=UPI0036840629